jgi:hypothetical protein
MTRAKHAAFEMFSEVGKVLLLSKIFFKIAANHMTKSTTSRALTEPLIHL